MYTGMNDIDKRVYAFTQSNGNLIMKEIMENKETPRSLLPQFRHSYSQCERLSLKRIDTVNFTLYVLVDANALSPDRE